METSCKFLFHVLQLVPNTGKEIRLAIFIREKANNRPKQQVILQFAHMPKCSKNHFMNTFRMSWGFPKL